MYVLHPNTSWPLCITINDADSCWSWMLQVLRQVKASSPAYQSSAVGVAYKLANQSDKFSPSSAQLLQQPAKLLMLYCNAIIYDIRSSKLPVQRIHVSLSIRGSSLSC